MANRSRYREDPMNYSEVAPSMNWDPEVGYFSIVVGTHRPQSAGFIRMHQHPKPEPAIKGRPKLAVGDLAAAVRREPATPAEAARMARRDYRRATGWWRKEGAA